MASDIVRVIVGCTRCDGFVVVPIPEAWSWLLTAAITLWPATSPLDRPCVEKDTEYGRPRQHAQHRCYVKGIEP